MITYKSRRYLNNLSKKKKRQKKRRTKIIIRSNQSNFLSLKGLTLYTLPQLTTLEIERSSLATSHWSTLIVWACCLCILLYQSVFRQRKVANILLNIYSSVSAAFFITIYVDIKSLKPHKFMTACPSNYCLNF